jgi:two-component sensor histidine kinase
MGDELTKEITDFALEEAVRMSQSSLGYLAFVNEQETVLTMHSWSKDAMALCGVKDGQHVYYIEKTGLWGEAIRQRRTIITNDYAAANEFKRGYPEGHVPIKRHMNIPVFDGGRIVLLIGVANKTEPYTEADVRQLTLLMQGMWQLIQRKHSQDMLRASLREKDLLLKEINHRVNNNLQLISNLLAMQRKYIRDKDALTVFTESQNRIRSIALVHEKLYLTKGFATIDLKEYIKELAHNVVYSFVSEKGRIALEVKVGDITMNIERAITCGLVLNELISNTLKHAFPEGRQGRISVSFMNDAGGNILMVYSDDGVGIPESIEPRKASSLGLRLIYTLVEKQLDGSIELIPGKGAEYRITFHQTEADFPLEARKNAA